MPACLGAPKCFILVRKSFAARAGKKNKEKLFIPLNIVLMNDAFHVEREKEKKSFCNNFSTGENARLLITGTMNGDHQSSHMHARAGTGSPAV